MAKLFIIPHDGTLEGDSEFYPSRAKALACSSKTSLEDLRAAYALQLIQEDPSMSNEELTDYVNAVRGGWILTEAGLTALDEFGDCLPEALGDRSCYANNHAMKNYLNLKAKGFLGPKPK